ncbi:hypothetical protein BDB00DRAFT_166405 [Zychaea mexicana]|uniref:uncharacterized protein n=1 Tax=Zychaea mexicana TaxID=64656 RepID=UPI0022FE04DE|nr:uncharacterized protein BDB00DRAFT_166405 [Zychaea mexicana]KAI9496166.1 hypothetical protein BDB00DRAFT_166405 [Zychaea mexicana]
MFENAEDDAWAFDTIRHDPSSGLYEKRPDTSISQPTPQNPASPTNPLLDDTAARPFRNRDPHPLVRLFENSQQPVSDSLLNASGVSTPLSKSPNILPQPISSLSPVMLPMQSPSITTPSPMIDLDSGAFASSQPLRPNSPSPGVTTAMSPADALLNPPTTPSTTAKDNKSLSTSKPDTLHPTAVTAAAAISATTSTTTTNREELDSGRPSSPLTIKPRKNSGPSVFGSSSPAAPMAPTDQLMSSNRLVPGGGHSRQRTPSSTPPNQPILGHSSKLSPRMASSSPETGIYASKPMARARSHSDQQSARDPTPGGLLKVEPHHHLKGNRHHRPAPSVPVAHTSTVATDDSSSGSSSGLKPNTAGLPLARRVRSATTLRQSEEDSVPLKALVANKQHQLYHASRKNSSNGDVDKVEQTNEYIKGKQLHDHRRSISADSTPKVLIFSCFY